MTSKELLESIKQTIEGVFYPRKMYKKTSDEFKQLERDLEVLEIIRKNIYEGGYGFYFNNDLLLCTEDYKKVKEWVNDR